jgi:hypothetical protein
VLLVLESASNEDDSSTGEQRTEGDGKGRTLTEWKSFPHLNFERKREQKHVS